MKFGYPCQNLTLQTKIRTCRLNTLQTKGWEYVKGLALENLEELEKILLWNMEHEILFFRVSSQTIPFASHPALDWEWWKDEDVLSVCQRIYRLKETHDLRLSSHPGQYTILNSPKDTVVQAAIEELVYHQQLMELIGGTDIILHTGGKYEGKEEGMKRFAHTFRQLPPSLQQMIRLENDDKIFTLKDVLVLHEACGVSICVDFHHHRCHHEQGDEIEALFSEAMNTWEDSITPKVHLSSGRTGPTDRAHHDRIFVEDFQWMVERMGGQSVDVMLEAKTKELALLRLLAEVEL